MKCKVIYQEMNEGWNDQMLFLPNSIHPIIGKVWNVFILQMLHIFWQFCQIFWNYFCHFSLFLVVSLWALHFCPGHWNHLGSRHLRSSDHHTQLILSCGQQITWKIQKRVKRRKSRRSVIWTPLGWVKTKYERILLLARRILVMRSLVMRILVKRIRFSSKTYFG